MTKREMIAKTPSAARRRLLSALGLLTLGAVASSCVAVQGAAPEGSTPRRPIVLVAGGWQGGWCWQKVTPLLSAAGHRVYTPTLTGLGDRAHLSQPTIDLEMHSQDLAAFLDMEDLQDVMLVGHSYAGFVISAVAERARARLHSLVYLDAFIPEAGKRVVDYLLPVERRQAIIEAGRQSGYVAPIPLTALGVTDESDLAWATPRLVNQPYGTFDQPIVLAAPAASGLPRSFIACTNPPSGSFGQFAALVKQDPSWRYHELATGHQAMMTMPRELAKLLGQLAEAT